MNPSGLNYYEGNPLNHDSLENKKNDGKWSQASSLFGGPFHLKLSA